MAPATNNSIVFAIVDPDNITIKAVIAIITVDSRAPGLVRLLQIITGANSSVAMTGVIRIRANLVTNDFRNMWTLGSLEIRARWYYYTISTSIRSKVDVDLLPFPAIERDELDYVQL